MHARAMSQTHSANHPSHLRAIEALYSGHHSWLYATLKRKLGNAMDAADLAQDTFTRILASQVTVIEQPRAYLSCVAKGILINWYQTQGAGACLPGGTRQRARTGCAVA